jgi:heme exporter protein B
MNWIHGTWAVLEKDLRLEMRSRYAVNMLLMFVLSSLLLVAFAVGQDEISPRLRAALLWIVILFSASIGLGRAFVAEEERGTVLLLRLNVRGSMVYAGKLAFNFLLLLAVDIVATAVVALVLDLDVAVPGLLAAVLALGSLGLAGATTLLAAIIARASNRGPLLPVLLFPILVPLLLSVVSGTREALEGGAGWASAGDELATLAGFAGVIITTAVLLFDFVWDD